MNKVEIEYNYNELYKLLAKKYGLTRLKNIDQFCKESKISPFKFKSVTNNRSYFNQSEITKMKKVLKLSDDDISKVFLDEIEILDYTDDLIEVKELPNE